MGIFSKKMNGLGAVSGMITGISFTAGYILWFKFISPETSTPSNWLFGISPEGIGALGMLLNFLVARFVYRFASPPSADTQEMVEAIRAPGSLEG